MKILLYAAVVWMMVACNSQEKKAKALYKNDNKALIQEQDAGGILVRVTYLPINWEQILGRTNPDANTEISFKLNLVLPKNTDHRKGSAEVVSNADSLFFLAIGKDTLSPLLAQQVPNGNPENAEFLVTFKRAEFTQNDTLRLLFKDWLYTHSKMGFPFEVKNIKNIDSLSSRL